MRQKIAKLAKYGTYGFLSLSFMAACGKDQEGQSKIKVTNGLEIDRSDYPSVVLLLLNGRSICTATFVNDSQVVTAAHCVAALRSSRPDIRLVEPILDENGQTRFQVRARAKDFVVQGDYSLRENNGVNPLDLAVVNFPAHTAPGVRAISSYSPEVDQEITIVGFGNNKNSVDEAGQQSGQGSGTKRVGRNFVAEKADGMITFAGLAEATEDIPAGDWTASGSGDSGGPLFIRGRLAGITSGGGVMRDEEGNKLSISKYVDLNSQDSRNFLAENLRSDY